MNLRFVEAFYWAAQLKSITRSAEKLFLTQSAVSSRIQALEQELGVLLVDRRDKRFRLTTAGQRFLSYAERLLAVQREVKQQLGTACVVESLRIGAIESVLHTWLIPFVQQLYAGENQSSLQLTIETTPVLLDQLKRGNLDLVFAAAPAEGSGLRAQQLPSIEMSFVASTQHHPRRAQPSLQQMAAAGLLTFQRGSQPHMALMDLLAAQGVQAPRVHSVSSISAMLILLERGFGYATLPRAAAERFLTSHQLRLVRRVGGLALAPVPLFVSYRADPSSQAAEQAALAAIDCSALRLRRSGPAKKSPHRKN